MSLLNAMILCSTSGIQPERILQVFWLGTVWMTTALLVCACLYLQFLSFLFTGHHHRLGLFDLLFVRYLVNTVG